MAGIQPVGGALPSRRSTANDGGRLRARRVRDVVVLPYAPANERRWTALAAVLEAAPGPDAPADAWLDLSEIDELAEPMEVRAWVRRTHADAAGTATRPADRPDWFRFGWWAEMGPRSTPGSPSSGTSDSVRRYP